MSLVSSDGDGNMSPGGNGRDSEDDSLSTTSTNTGSTDLPSPDTQSLIPAMSFQNHSFVSGRLSGVHLPCPPSMFLLNIPSMTTSPSPTPGARSVPSRIAFARVEVMNPLLTKIVDPPVEARENGRIRLEPGVPCTTAGPKRTGGPSNSPLIRTRRNAKSGSALRLERTRVC